MTCQTPLSFEELSQYWAEALASAELDRIEEHLLGCATCSEQSARIAAVLLALRAFTPPAITRAEVERLRASGLKIAENSFGPGSGHSVHFSPELDLMIHRLIGFDLGNVARLRVTVRAEGTGEVLFEDPNAPFDAQEGVLIACLRHYSAMPPDTVFELHAREAQGVERSATYSILHVFA